MANSVFADLGLPHADELKAASDRARSYDEFRRAAGAIRALHQAYDAILNEEIPDDLRELVERLK